MLDLSFLFETVPAPTKDDPNKTEQKLSETGMGLAALLGFGGGAAGAFDPTINPTGYQGSIPNYTAVRKRVPNTFDPDRRPGSGGRRYFTDATYVDMDADTAQADLDSAIKAAGTQADALAFSNRARQKEMAGEPVPVDTTKSKMYPTDEEPLIQPSFAAVPTARSVLSQNMSPSEEISPFTSPYQYIEDDPTHPLNIATPYKQGRKVNKGYSEGGIVEIIEMLRSAPELLSYLGATIGLGGLGSYGINRGMNAYREAEAEKIRRMGKGKREGGIAELGTRKQRYLDGETDGMADKVPATIDNKDPAALSDGEYVIPADVVSHLGNGNSDAGAKVLDEMLSRVRKARTGETKQAPEINPKEFLPA